MAAPPEFVDQSHIIVFAKLLVLGYILVLSVSLRPPVHRQRDMVRSLLQRVDKETVQVGLNPVFVPRFIRSLDKLASQLSDMIDLGLVMAATEFDRLL